MLFPNVITKPTRVSKTSQAIIDHIFSNDSESIITPKVHLYKISDHFPIICGIENLKFKAPKPETLTFRNLKTINGLKFRNDLKTLLIPLMYDFLNSKVTRCTFNEHMTKLVEGFIVCSFKKQKLENKSVSNKNIG